ncbi:hypothetical protein [uncultured Chitinophaga sp.]|uniref:hypothetical protein n=1 Tax=uncultured Chitinophaga sp. TaxID=339340 RepID=UPI0025CD4477|nr:hypothetical protein [uncultured Chitinophaga sp.]
MLKRFTLICMMAISLFACKKGEPVEEFYFASFRAQIISLPETPDMTVFVDNKEVDTLAAAGTLSPIHMLPAGKKIHLQFKDKNTGAALLDTLLAPVAGEFYEFKLAWSEVLGMKEFVKGGTDEVHPDSVEVRLYNKLPVEIMPEGVTVDAYLYKAGEYETPLKVFPKFERNKMHPLGIALRYIGADGSPLGYELKFKDVATGEFLLAGGRDVTQFSFTENGRFIVTVMHLVQRGRYSYATEVTKLPY